MTKPQAMALYAKILAAWPGQRDASEATDAVWLARLEPLNPQISLAAIDALIDTNKFFPAVAEFLEMYRRESSRPRFQDRALLPAPLTEEERADNLRRLRELTSRYSTKEVA